MKFLKENWLLLSIIALALVLRLWKLASIPIGFNDDEAAFGYNAYSILTTGRDEWGRLLPFPAFESFGDWKLVGYLYPVVVSQFFFSANEFATRLPSALFGVLAVFTTYLLAKKLFEDSDSSLITHHSSLKSVALLATLFLAISPWHIVAARNAFESDILIFFITTGTWLFLEGLKKPKYIKFSFIALALSFYVYRSSWLFVPLFLLCLLYFYKEELKKISAFNFKLKVAFLILLLPLVPMVLTFSGKSRFLQESFIYGVSKVGIINEINEKRGECQKFAPNIACQIIYNKYTAFITAFVNNYFENLSPGTYFTKGIANGYQSFANRGLFYSFELPLLIAGAIGLIVQKNPNSRILLAWILLAPIGASFTGIGNPGRLNIIMPAPQIIEAFGLFYIIGQIKRVNYAKIIYGLFAIVVLFSLAKLTADMFFHYPQISGRFQRYGYRQLFEYLESQKNNYDQIIVSRASDDAKQYSHYLFFEKIDPRIFHDSNLTIKYRGADLWQEVEQIENIKFTRFTPDLEDIAPASLLAVAHNQILYSGYAQFKVLYPNGDIAFEVYDVDLLRAKINEVFLRIKQEKVNEK